MIKEIEKTEVEINDIAKELARRVQDLGLNRTDLANILGVTRANVSYFLKAKTVPNVSSLRKYVKALGGEVSLSIKWSDNELIKNH